MLRPVETLMSFAQRFHAVALLGVPRLTWSGWLVPLMCWAAFGLIGAGLTLTKPYPSAFDELEHISYAAFLQETGRLTPQFELQRTLAVADMERWDDRANYLGHPSPFYVFAGWFLDRRLPPEKAILLPRAASAGLVLAGVAAALWAGRRQFGRDRMAFWTFCVGVALCPKLLAVAGQVTNDSLAFLGGAVAYAAASVGRQRRFGPAIAAAGLMLALWSKPNAGLAVAAWLGPFALLRPGRAALLAALLAGALIGVIPYAPIVAGYGALVPVTVEQFGNVRQLDGFGSYGPAFLVSLGSSWAFAATDAWPPTLAGAVTSLLFWTAMGGVVWGGLAAIRTGRARSGWGAREAVAVAAPLAFAVVLPIHFWFSATKLGFSLPAASFRYYLPMWPVLMHALAYGIMSVRVRRQRIGLVTLCGASLALGWASL